MTSDTGTTYPEAPSDLTIHHPGTLDMLNRWADNDERDVLDSVDAQASMLATRTPYSWPIDSCATTGDAKAFLGNVMRYKRARLGMDKSGPIGPENIEFGTRLMMAVDPKTSTGSGVYFAPFTEPIEVEVVRYGTNDGAGDDLRVKRCDDGDASMSQSVGRAFLSYVVRPESGPVEPEAPVEPTPLVHTVASLLVALADAKREHVNDMRSVEQHFWREAYSRGWCREAETVIRAMNEELAVKISDDRTAYAPNVTFSVEVSVDDVCVDIEGYGFTSEGSVSVTIEVEDMDQDTGIDTLSESIEYDHIKMALESVLYPRPISSFGDWEIEDYSHNG